MSLHVRQCACGRVPDPGLHPEGGCACKDQDERHEERRRDLNRRTRKPSLFFVDGQWWVLAFGRRPSWNAAAIDWVEARND